MRAHPNTVPNGFLTIAYIHGLLTAYQAADTLAQQRRLRRRNDASQVPTVGELARSSGYLSEDTVVFVLKEQERTRCNHRAKYRDILESEASSSRTLKVEKVLTAVRLAAFAILLVYLGIVLASESLERTKEATDTAFVLFAILVTLNEIATPALSGIRKEWLQLPWTLLV